MINAVPYIIGVNNCEFGWVLPTVRDLQCCYLYIILLIYDFLINMIPCIMQTMKLPPYTDGLDEDVARQVLQSSLAVSLKVRGHFQNNPVLLLHWPGSVFVLLERYILEANFVQFDSFLPWGSNGQQTGCCH